MELVVVVLSEVKADGNIKVVLSLVGLVVPWLRVISVYVPWVAAAKQAGRKAAKWLRLRCRVRWRWLPFNPWQK